MNSIKFGDMLWEIQTNANSVIFQTFGENLKHHKTIIQRTFIYYRCKKHGLL